jgi:hypothetical protein
MMQLCGLATKNTPVFSGSTSPFLQIGGNDPQYEDCRPRTMWSLSNAFTSAFKEMEPIPAYRANARLAGFLAAV